MSELITSIVSLIIGSLFFLGGLHFLRGMNITFKKFFVVLLFLYIIGVVVRLFM